MKLTAPVLMAALLCAGTATGRPLRVPLQDPLAAPAAFREPAPDEAARIIGLLEAASDLSTDASVGRFLNRRRLVEARQDLAEAERLALATYGPSHAVTLTLQTRLARLMILLGDADGARDALVRAAPGLEALGHSAEAAEARDALDLISAGGDEQALRRLEDRYAGLASPTERLSLADGIARLHLDAGRTAAAGPWVARMRPFILSADLDQAALVSGPALTAGRYDLTTGDYPSAETMFMVAVGAEAEMERLSVQLVDGVLGLSLAAQGQGRIDEAVQHLRDAALIVESRDKALGAGEGEAGTVFAGVFRHSVTGFWRMSDRLEARRRADEEARLRQGS